MQEPVPVHSLSDEEILSGYRKQGDRELIGELFRRYSRFVFLVCMKYLSDQDLARDAAMQIFENLFTDLKKHDIKNFKPWLHSVTKNHCLMALRSLRKEMRLAAEMQKDLEQSMEYGYFLHHGVDAEQRLHELEDAILLLNREQRICIELFYLKKKCYREIVEETGSTYNEVKSNIQNGKRNLRILLSQRNER
ncbi:MAG TPA: sigma-70 family RNA polymerase sigma factor [Bacteroidales bacterium]|nr:sigma-70 family RNA polymerase sigma factor [Bacteroidales bacterium]